MRNGKHDNEKGQKEMKKKQLWIVSLVAVLCLTAIEVTALQVGMDGVMMSAIVGGIVAVATGTGISLITRNKK